MDYLPQYRSIAVDVDWSGSNCKTTNTVGERSAEVGRHLVGAIVLRPGLM